MDKLAVSVTPIRDLEGWMAFCQETATGERAAAHKDFLRRGGITAEHVFPQPTPVGDFMVLIWEGVDPTAAAAHMGTMIEAPQSEHERYLRDHVAPELHGLDLSQPPPPPAEHITSIVV